MNARLGTLIALLALALAAPALASDPVDLRVTKDNDGQILLGPPNEDAD